jgi:hypothetical protein
MVGNIELTMDIKDAITWKFTNDGHYSALRANTKKFENLIHSMLEGMIWKV